jgi:hypothetical protein
MLMKFSIFWSLGSYESEDMGYNDFTSSISVCVDYYPNEIMYTTYDEYGYSVQNDVSNEIKFLQHTIGDGRLSSYRICQSRNSQ